MQSLIQVFMAKPIKETPVLVGKDAKAFVAQMKVADEVRVSQQERTRIRQNFAKLVDNDGQFAPVAVDAKKGACYERNQRSQSLRRLAQAVLC